MADVHDRSSPDFREAAAGFAHVLKGEMQLAKAEIKHTASKMTSRGSRAVGFALFAALGIFPFLAFLVIGLGQLIGNYWLSALIISVLMFGVGGALAYRAFAKLQKEQYKLPRLRESIEHETKFLSDHVAELRPRIFKSRRAA
ncbi:MAG: phage holin family protein [Bdellovibrionota bacterium]